MRREPLSLSLSPSPPLLAYEMERGEARPREERHSISLLVISREILGFVGRERWPIDLFSGISVASAAAFRVGKRHRVEWQQRVWPLFRLFPRFQNAFPARTVKKAVRQGRNRDRRTRRLVLLARLPFPRETDFPIRWVSR